MLASIHSSLGFAPTAPLRAPAMRTTAPVMETVEDLEVLATKLNPIVGYWNPLGLGEEAAVAVSTGEGLGESTYLDQAGAIGFLRHAEIKHGRIAMFGFVGFIVGENGIHWPWNIAPGIPFADIAAAGGAPAQWDAVPTLGKVQFFLFCAFMELWGETNPDGLTPHYMKGGKPGAYPTFDLLRKELGQGPLDFFDPFGFTKKMSPERKEKALLAEINNGRLAMLGLLSFCAAASVEGSVPALTGKIKHYSGEVMAPFSASDVSLPFVEKMLSSPPLPLSGIAPNF